MVPPIPTPIHELRALSRKTASDAGHISHPVYRSADFIQRFLPNVIYALRERNSHSLTYIIDNISLVIVFLGVSAPTYLAALTWLQKIKYRLITPSSNLIRARAEAGARRDPTASSLRASDM